MKPLAARLARLALVAVGAIVVSACATPAAAPATEQPAMSRMAAPYASELRRVGISSVMVYPNRARVRVSTRSGEVYFRYPAELPPMEFAVYVGAQDIEVDSDGFTAANAAQYEAAMKAILPEAVRQANANNVMERQRSLSN